MGAAERAFAAVLLASAIALAPVKAQEALRPTYANLNIEAWRGCLNPKERRALIESGAVLRLAVAVHAVRGSVPGVLVRARLCHRGEGLVYVLTVLGHDGKVTRVTIDAVKGTLVGVR